MSNCLYEATLQKVEADCACTPAKFVDIVEGYNACEGAGKRCMLNIMDKMGAEIFIDDAGERKRCLAACEDQKHTFLVSQSVFPNRQSFHKVRIWFYPQSMLMRLCGTQLKAHTTVSFHPFHPK